MGAEEAMSTALAINETPKVALHNDPRVRAVAYQILVVSLVLLGGWILVSNTVANLARLGVASGFGFLSRPSGFDIGQSMIDYSSSSTFGRAFLVGFLNTILVAVVGIICATIIGFVMGIARLSHNWLVNTLAAVYVETVRNVPLLLQLLLIYAIVVHALPQPRESGELFGLVLLNTGGLFLPRAVPQPGFAVFAIISLLAVLAIPFVLRWAARKRELTGQPVKTLPIVLGLIALIPISYLVTGMPVSWDLPVMGRFRASGGLAIQPEFVALVLGLAVYTGSFIAEIVRSGIQAVSKGQWEAARLPGAVSRPDPALHCHPAGAAGDHPAADQPVSQPDQEQLARDCDRLSRLLQHRRHDQQPDRPGGRGGGDHHGRLPDAQPDHLVFHELVQRRAWRWWSVSPWPPNPLPMAPPLAERHGRSAGCRRNLFATPFDTALTVVVFLVLADDRPAAASAGRC